MAGAAQWKLRRLAPQALRVVARRAPEIGALASFEGTLVPAAAGALRDQQDWE